jgi:hypothetical protein
MVEHGGGDSSFDGDVSMNFEDADLGGFHPDADNDADAAAADGKRHVRFADEVDVNQFSRLGASTFDAMFYASHDLAEFRYEAFMEEAGLEIADYD